MKIYCCGCGEEVDARKTSGAEVYSHRSDLHHKIIWKCDSCGNFIGCHDKTNKPDRPLGVIPTPEIKKARMHIHRLLDPIWKSGDVKRNKLYKVVAEELGKESYHTADIRSIEEGREVYKAIQQVKARICQQSAP